VPSGAFGDYRDFNKDGYKIKGEKNAVFNFGDFEQCFRIPSDASGRKKGEK
jgi:hypothetical protein